MKTWRKIKRCLGREDEAIISYADGCRVWVTAKGPVLYWDLRHRTCPGGVETGRPIGHLLPWPRSKRLEPSGVERLEASLSMYPVTRGPRCRTSAGAAVSST